MRTAKTLSISIPAAEFRKPKSFAEVIELARQDSERKGLNKLTMREINQEIAAYRQEVHTKSKRKQAS